MNVELCEYPALLSWASLGVHGSSSTVRNADSSQGQNILVSRSCHSRPSLFRQRGPVGQSTYCRVCAARCGRESSSALAPKAAIEARARLLGSWLWCGLGTEPAEEFDKELRFAFFALSSHQPAQLFIISQKGFHRAKVRASDLAGFSR